MIEINEKINRIELNMKAVQMGKDLCIILTGGKEHIGSVTVVEDKSCRTIGFKDHKENIITEAISNILKEEYRL
jgi:gallate decarboxylase subunit D